MKWRNKLLQILRWPMSAVSGMTTIALGVNAAVGHETGIGARDGSDHDPILLPNTLNATADDRYAAHRSHRSHGSHRSHRSSSGGGSRSTPSTPAPQPQYTPQPSTPAPSVTPGVIPRTEQRAPETDASGFVNDGSQGSGCANAPRPTMTATSMACWDPRCGRRLMRFKKPRALPALAVWTLIR